MKIALRSLRRTPWLCATVILILGFGVGANVALFSMCRAVLLRPIPGVRDSSNLMRFRRTQSGRAQGNQSYPDYVDFRDRSKTIRDLVAERLISLRLSGTPAQVLAGAVVTPNYFQALGAKAVLGRLFDSQDNREPVALISEAFWHRQFAGDPHVLGSIIRLNGFPVTITGVIAAPFEGVEFGERTEIWMPVGRVAEAMPRFASHAFLEDRRAGWLTWYGRLAPGATLATASREWTHIAEQLEARYPQSNQGRRWELHPHASMSPSQREQLTSLLRLLLGAVGLVLLIACGNVANLLLARAAGRAREMAIRLALGAGRATLVRELLAESLMLGAAAGTLGLLLAPWFSAILAKAWPRTPDQVFVLDWPLLAFGAAISLVCVLLCGLAPAWSASATHVNTVLKDASPTAGRGRGRVQRAFVAAQVALSVGLVAVGALVLGSMRRIVAIEPGFQAQALVTGAMDISLLGYDAELGGRFFTNLLHRISEVPGVRSAALAKSSPAVDWSDRLNIFHPGQMPAEGFTEERAPNAIRTDRNVVTPGYFATLGISLIVGRDFRDSDRATSAKVAIVSESLARRLWGSQNAVGRQIAMPLDTRTAPTLVEIVGVAADSRYRTVLDDPPLLLYVPLAQNYDSISRVILAVDGPAAGFREPLRRALQSISPDLPVPAPATLQEQIDRSLWDRRAAASLLTLFSALALGLACTGVYGVVAHTAAQRSREIGIRMALGAARSDVRRHIAAHALRLTLAGVAIGIPLALWAKPAAAAFLYRADTAIAPTLTLVAALFTAIALIAAALPAHRAASTDPATVLRGD